MLVLVAVALITCAACDKSLRMGGAPGQVLAATATRAGTTGLGASDMTIELWVKPAIAATTKAACAPEGDTAIRSAERYTYKFPVDSGGSVVQYEFALNRWVVGIAPDGDVWFAVRRQVQFAWNPDSPADQEHVANPLCTNLPGAGVRDGSWHHIAVQRRVNGAVRVWVDGAIQAEGILEAGDLTVGDSQGFPKRTEVTVGGSKVVNGLLTSPNISGEPYDPYVGLLDEARLSSTLRYSGPTFPLAVNPFATDASTDRLWHFDGMTRRTVNGGEQEYIPDASENPQGLSVLYLANIVDQPLTNEGAFSQGQ